MKTLEFKTHIAASPEHVWKTMIEPGTYRQWVNVSWPESFYVGEWKEGEEILFTGPGGGGTQAKVLQINPYTLIDTEHIAVVNEDGTLDKESAMAKDWIG